MRRWGFIFAIGAAATWPFAASTQQMPLPVIGFLSALSSAANDQMVEAFHDGLKESGYVVGQNVTIDFRWADGRYDRLPGLAAELVRRNAAVIVASGGNVSALAAKAATTSIPVVFTAAADPVANGLVVSLSRPGGNLTGNGTLTVELDAKRLELLRELLPSARLVGALVNPDRPGAESQARDIETAARTLGQQLLVLYARSEQDFETVFARLTERRAGALLVAADPFFSSRREQLAGLAARHAIPAIYQWREFVEAGGLISYGPSRLEAYRGAGIYVGRILKGAKPGDLPVQQPATFELVVNARAAKALGIAIPPSVLARADEVIE